MNPEGYQDRTAENAIAHAARNERPPQIVTDLVHALRRETHRWGFEIEGRITLRDVETGKEWR